MRKSLIAPGLVILNLVLKILFLDGMSISGDEAFSIFHARMDIHSIIVLLSQGNNPPLFEIILHYWIKVFGISPFAVRFLPMLFSSLTVFFVYRIGERFFNIRVAIAAGLMYTFSNYITFFSHETRVYPLFALMTTLSMYSFLNLVKNHRTGTYFIILVLSNIILSYAHFLGILIPFIQLFCCLIFRPLRKEMLVIILLGILLSVVGYIPYLEILLTRLSSSVRYGTWLRPVDIDQAYNLIRGFSNKPVPAVIFLSAMAIGLIKLVRSKDEHISIYSKIVIVWFILPYSIMFLISFKYLLFNVPIFLDRYVIFTSIGFYLVVALTFEYISRFSGYRSIIMAIPVVLMLSTCELNPDNHMHISEVVRKIKELKTKNTVVYICPGYYSGNFAYYYDLDYFKLMGKTDSVYSRIDSCLSRESIHAIYSDKDINISECMAADRILYLDVASNALLPDNHVYSYLSSNFNQVSQYKYPAVYSISVFRKK